MQRRFWRHKRPSQFFLGAVRQLVTPELAGDGDEEINALFLAQLVGEPLGHFLCGDAVGHGECDGDIAMRGFGGRFRFLCA